MLRYHLAPKARFFLVNDSLRNLALSLAFFSHRASEADALASAKPHQLSAMLQLLRFT
jgi:hypothetical protein